MTSDTKMICGILALSIVIIGLILGFGGQSTSNAVDQSPITVEEGQLVREDSQSLGNPDASVTIVEFADYQCPACALATPILNQLILDHPADVRLVYRNFPLTSIHKNAFPAAQAAEAAAAQAKFWEYHDLLYAKQTEWQATLDPKKLFTEYAASLGLNTDQFATDFLSQTVIDRIRLDLGDSLAFEHQSTPTIYVNGVQTNGFSPETLEVAVEAALAAPKLTPE